MLAVDNQTPLLLRGTKPNTKQAVGNVRDQSADLFVAMRIDLAIMGLVAVLNLATAFQLPPRIGRTGHASKVQQHRSSVSESPAADTSQDSDDGGEEFDWHKQASNAWSSLVLVL